MVTEVPHAINAAALAYDALVELVSHEHFPLVAIPVTELLQQTQHLQCSMNRTRETRRGSELNTSQQAGFDIERVVVSVRHDHK